MCGIAGVGSVAGDVPSEWIHHMMDTLAHRGPDDEGYLAIDMTDGGVAPLTGKDSRINGQPIESYREKAGFFLGHRRLSIIDPSPMGHQPMCNHNGKAWVVFNGEIYNYIELRTQLQELGYTFHTGSDTEVLLAAYEEWDTNCLNYFDGMWSFVIYDQRKKILFGARDRFGVKPLYYFQDAHYFAFSSEIKGLVTLPFIEKQLNPAALFDFLVFGGLPTEAEGTFKNILELLPAHAFTYEPLSGQMKKWRYFTLEYTSKTGFFDEEKGEKYIKTIRELVFNAVKLRLRSDVPVGSALSGGIDSSTIVCAISKLMTLEGTSPLTVDYRQKVFTASFPGSVVDESNWAQLAAESSGALAFRTFPKAEEFLADLTDIAYTQDIPFSSPSVYAQYRVMKLANENGVKVLLDGQGADELFTGYTIYYDVFCHGLLKEKNFKAFIHELGCMDNAPLTKNQLVSALYRQVRRQMMPKTMLSKLRMDQHRQPHYKYINNDFWNSYKERFHLLEERDFNDLNHMLYEFFTRQKLSHLLKYEDRNSMRFSVESRTPFADYLPLVRYMFAIPAVYKIHDGWSKYLLREAMKEVLPEAIRLRTDKKGFFIPDYDWLKILKKELMTYVDDNVKDYVNVPLVLADLDKGLAHTTSEVVRIMWSIVSFAVWRKVFSI